MSSSEFEGGLEVIPAPTGPQSYEAFVPEDVPQMTSAERLAQEVIADLQAGKVDVFFSRLKGALSTYIQLDDAAARKANVEITRLKNTFLSPKLVFEEPTLMLSISAALMAAAGGKQRLRELRRMVSINHEDGVHMAAQGDTLKFTFPDLGDVILVAEDIPCQRVDNTYTGKHNGVIHRPNH